MEFDLPLYAVQRTVPDRWLVRAPNADPFLPAVHAVAVLGGQADDHEADAYKAVSDARRDRQHRLARRPNWQDRSPGRSLEP